MNDPVESRDARRKEANECCNYNDKLKAKRRTFESHWQECMDYILPRKGDIVSTRTPGDKRGSELYDSTAIQANLQLASALHGMLTNPATRFFDLMMEDAGLNQQEDVKGWLQEVAEKMFQVMNNSNFQTEIHELYIDLGAIGTACMYVGEHEESVVHFGARPMREIYVDEDNLGLIDTVHRCFKWKPRQIIQEFGEKGMNEDILKMYREGREDDVEILHCVGPSKDKESRFRFESKYILVEQKDILSRGGFHEFPYVVPRWTKTSGEVFGRGPGMDSLPDIKMVNKMMETVLQGAQMTVRPPMLVNDDGVIGKVRLTPGGLTVVRNSDNPPVRPLTTDARIDFGYQAVDDVRKRIRAGFYGDLFTLREGPQMTATEVNTISEQQMRLMGPVLGRQHFELLRPTIERVFGIMYRRKLLPPIPGKISGAKFDVRYSSLIARAQRINEGQNFIRAIQVAAPVVNVDPAAMDNIDADKTLKYVLDVYGVPHAILRSEREVQKKREARAQAQADQIKQAQQQHQADLVQKTAPGAAQLMQTQGGNNGTA